MCGDGGFSMLFGDLLTIVQENLPIKIVIFRINSASWRSNNSRRYGRYLYKPKKSYFGRVAEAMGLWGRRVEKVEDLEKSVTSWLAQPGPALLDVKVNRMESVMPPFIALEPAIGMALYTTKAILHGKGGDVWEMARENFP